MAEHNRGAPARTEQLSKAIEAHTDAIVEAVESHIRHPDSRTRGSDP